MTPPRVVVSDLGSAKLLAEASGVTVTTGTPAYMAPEQIHQREGFDGRADVYAAAAVTYHLLSGHPAFPDRTAAEVDRLLTRSLSWDPEKRPTTAAEFARELERLLVDVPASPRRREISTAVVLVASVVLAVVLFEVTYLWASM